MTQLKELVSDKLSDADIADIADILAKYQKSSDSTAKDLALLILRLSMGTFLSGHGSQKLFGWFGGYGLDATGKAFESGFGLKPGKLWALSAGLSEFGGGVLTALGLMHPLGPLASIASMLVGTVKVHWGKPIWVDKGGAEMPLNYIVIALALIIAGPGKFSVDRMLGIRVPAWLVATVAASEAALIAYVVSQNPTPAPLEGQTSTDATEGQNVERR